jgi:uncharacterized membrane protein YdfJ with MMPL/SSD domain
MRKQGEEVSPLKRSNNIAARMGRWSAGHRKTAIFGWLAFVLVAVLIGGAIGTKKLDSDEVATGQSARAQEIIDRGGFRDAADESVIVQSETRRAGDPAFRAVIAEVVRTVSRFDTIDNVSSPLDADGKNLVSKDGRSVLVQFEIDDTDNKSVDRVDPVLAAVEGVQDKHPEFVVEQFGAASATQALDDTIGEDFKQAEFLALPITLGILIVVFGALVAAGIPLLLGLSAVMAAIGLLAIPSQLWAMDDAANSVILLIGLAVGVDYSLFYLKREREERAAGKGPRAALEAAAATSGRAVLISGLTVIVALAGMFLGGSAIWTSIAIGTILVVAIAVAGSLTVLPAMLSWLGERVEKGRIPFLHRLRRDRGESRVWGAVLDRVLRRPGLAAAASAGFLAILAVPTLFMDTALSSTSDLPRSIPIMKTYDRIQAAFPGGPLPAVVAVEAEDVSAPAVQNGLRELRSEAIETGLMSDPITVQPNRAGTAAIVSVPLAGEGTDDLSNQALAALRDDVIPSTIGSVDGVEVAVTGETAGSKDFDELAKQRVPLVMGFVLLFAFGLLLVAFRSLVLAAKAIVLNMLSVAAAYGLLVAVFQWGWGESLFGFESTGAITSWLPLFMFVILFGLSMDYHVFILSRIREAFDRGLSTEQAVTHGIKTTAGVVTAAAVVMVAVFSIFLTLSTVEMKQVGFGLAAAILIDATIVRAVLLPAAMKLLGDWNWYLPKWLQWLPRLEHEAAPEPAEAAPALRPAAR